MTAPRIRTMVTPEGVPLHLHLADRGERVGAFLLDVVIIVLILALLTAFAYGVFSNVASELAEVIWLLGFFLLRNFYFALFELRPRAATPGKRMMGIRVAAQDGGRLSADAILGRNLLRELELFLPLGVLAFLGEGRGWLVPAGLGWAGLFAMVPLFNRDGLRIGDLVGGTWVVRTPRLRLLADLAAPEPSRAGGPPFTDTLAFSDAQLDAYGIKELHVLEDVLRKQDVETMRAVADRIMAKVGWTRGYETDREFLHAYYAALRRRLERGLLFGRRRRDKHDRG